jgi:hypothetical protein
MVSSPPDLAPDDRLPGRPAPRQEGPAVNTTRTRKALVALAVTGALGVGAIVPALAQDTGEGDPAAEEFAERDRLRDEHRAERETMREEHRAERETVRAEHRAAFAEALAAELDLDVDRVAAALDAVHEQHRAEHAGRRAEHQGRGPAADQPGHRGGGPRGPGAGMMMDPAA